jgi:hypothetical protein
VRTGLFEPFPDEHRRNQHPKQALTSKYSSETSVRGTAKTRALLQPERRIPKRIGDAKSYVQTFLAREQVPTAAKGAQTSGTSEKGKII